MGNNVVDSIIVSANDGRKLFSSGSEVGVSPIATLPNVLGEVGMALGVYDGMILRTVLGTLDLMSDGVMVGTVLCTVDGTELNDGDTLPVAL